MSATLFVDHLLIGICCLKIVTISAVKQPIDRADAHDIFTANSRCIFY